MRPEIRRRWSSADRSWLAVAVLFYGPVAIFALYWILRHGETTTTYTALLGRSITESLALGFAVGGALHFLLRLSERTAAMRGLREALADHTHDLQRHTQLYIALLSGFGEELLFRGVLQTQWGLAGATLCFALVHVPIEKRMAPWPFIAGAAGLVFGLMTLHTGGVLAACIAHTLSNALSLRHLSRTSVTTTYDANTLQPRL